MSSTGMGRVFQRGRVWWIDYSYRGRRVRESSGSTKRSTATKLLKRRLEEMGRGRLIGPDAEKVTFQDLRTWIEDDYRTQGRKSLRRLKVALSHLEGFFGLHRAIDITTDRIRGYIVYREEEGAAASTIRNETNALRRAFRLGVQAERLDRVPHFPSIRVDAVREGFLTMADVDAMVRHMGPDLGPVVRFAALTGWRLQEVLGLKWSEVDFEGGTVRLPAGRSKTNEAREFPFSVLPPLKELLRSQRDRTRALERESRELIPWVFHRDGRRIRDLRGKWQSAAKLAGLDRFRFHDLRRTAIRNFERAGVPRVAAMRLSGHRTESVYRRYAICDAVVLAEGVEKLARLYEQKGGMEERSVVPLREVKKG